MILEAIQHFSPKDAIAHPPKARNVRVWVVGERYPFDVAAGGTDYTQAHDRIGIAGLGILFHINRGMRGHPVGDWVGGHSGFVHAQKDDAFAVGRPEVIAADTQLFGVDPIDLAVQQVDIFLFVVFVFVIFVAGELGLTFAGYVAHIKVVPADVGQAAAV